MCVCPFEQKLKFTVSRLLLLGCWESAQQGATCQFPFCALRQDRSKRCMDLGDFVNFILWAVRGAGSSIPSLRSPSISPFSHSSLNTGQSLLPSSPHPSAPSFSIYPFTLPQVDRCFLMSPCHESDIVLVFQRSIKHVLYC